MQKEGKQWKVNTNSREKYDKRKNKQKKSNNNNDNDNDNCNSLKKKQNSTLHTINVIKVVPYPFFNLNLIFLIFA